MQTTLATFRAATPDETRVQLQDQVVEVLLCLSAADGKLTPEEDRLVRSAALLLGLTVPGYERIKTNSG